MSTNTSSVNSSWLASSSFSSTVAMAAEVDGVELDERGGGGGGGGRGSLMEDSNNGGGAVEVEGIARGGGGGGGARGATVVTDTGTEGGASG